MYWLILVLFLGLLGLIFVASKKGSKLIKSKKIKIHLLDILISFMSGFLFALIVYLFISGANDKGTILL